MNHYKVVTFCRGSESGSNHLLPFGAIYNQYCQTFLKQINTLFPSWYMYIDIVPSSNNLQVISSKPLLLTICIWYGPHVSTTTTAPFFCSPLTFQWVVHVIDGMDYQGVVASSSSCWNYLWTCLWQKVFSRTSSIPLRNDRGNNKIRY